MLVTKKGLSEKGDVLQKGSIFLPFVLHSLTLSAECVTQPTTSIFRGTNYASSGLEFSFTKITDVF